RPEQPPAGRVVERPGRRLHYEPGTPFDPDPGGRKPGIARKIFMRRVVVTGMGMVTPVGRDMESTWSALLEGKSGVGPISLFDAQTFATRIAAEVKDFSLAGYRPDGDRWSNHSRNTKFAIAAAQMALDDSGLFGGSRPIDRDRFGVYLGAGEGQQ